MRSNILAFAAGIWLLQQQAALPGVLWWLAVPLWGWGAYRLRGGLGRRLAMVALWAVSGFLWAATFAHLRLADELPRRWEGEDIRVVGVVAALPADTERGKRFEFDVEKVLSLDASVPRHIQLAWYEDALGAKTAVPPPPLHAGERWRLTVRLKRPHGNFNPHGFDFEGWALERNLRALGYVCGDGDNLRLAERVWRPGYLIEAVREAVATRFREVLGERPYAGVLKALAIGEQNAISQSQWQVFSRTGVTHLMSISGLHVTMLSGFLFALAQFLWRRIPPLALRLPARKAAVLVGLATALGYAWLSGSGVPTMRTVYMLAVIAAALWLGRTAVPSRVLAVALGVVLLLDPWAVLAPGLWLSFGAVAVIFYVSIGRLRRPHWLREWGVTQWAVTLGLVPALLLLFQQVSLVSPLANAFAIPAVSLLVTPLTLLGAMVPVDFILLVAHQVMAWCMGALEALSRLPDAVWEQHAPPWWTAGLALLGIAWLLLPRGFPARWLGVFTFLPMFLVVPPGPPSGALWLTVLDVGQGLAVLARTQHHALLFDAGPRYTSESDSGNRVVVPYLRAAGVKRLDGLIVSHNDSDHSGGALSVLQALPVDWLASSLPADHPARAAARRDVPCYAGQDWEWDGVRFTMLHPTLESYGVEKIRNNDRGCTLKITSRYGSALLPADIEAKSEREILARAAPLLPAEVLVAGHHGSKTSSTEEFIAAVQPGTVVFTAGYRNRFGHPHPDVVARFRERGTKLQRSDRDGAVDFHFGEDGVKVTTWRENERKYWHER
ncbi:MAG: DNA internalization-related competence protein ComEC/Rec2 [Sulfuricella sp.]|nr:DNA internalization-related competence protein ComEC/Rec2 [Sulfuricella sp.]